MTIEVIEVSLKHLTIPPSVIRHNESFVYEHLKRYCSKFRPLPSVAVTFDGSHLILTSRYEYVAIAQDLGDDRIRAVLQGVTYEQLKRQGVPGVLGLVSQETLDREQQDSIIPCWHVLFFATAPDSHTMRQIEVRFRKFLQKTMLDKDANGVGVETISSFDVSGPCFEILFPTPVTDHVWAKEYHAFLTAISRELAPISTFQGRVFVEW